MQDELHQLFDKLIARDGQRRAQVPDPMVKPSDLNDDFPTEEKHIGDLQEPIQGVVDGLRDEGYKDLPNAQGPAETSLTPYTQDVNRDPASALNQSNTELGATAPARLNVPAPIVPQKIGADLIKVPGAATPKSTISPSSNETQATISNLSDQATGSTNGIAGMQENYYKANETKALADVSANQQQMDQASAKMEAQQKFVQDIHQKVTDANGQLNGELSQMVNIDPNRIWNKGSVGNKFSFLVAAAFGGLQSGAPLQNLITNDINTQVQDVKTHGAKAGNLVSLMEKYTGNLMDASKMAYDYQNKFFDLSVEAKRLGANATPEMLSKQTMEQILPHYENTLKNKLAVTKLQQENDRIYTTAKQNDAENALKAAGLNQNKAKIDISQGSLSSQDAAIVKPIAVLFNAAQDMKRIQHEGLDPSSSKYIAFAKLAAKGGFVGDGLATLLSNTSLNDKQKAAFIEHYQAERNFYIEKTISDSGNRINREKAETIADGQMVKFYDNPLTVRHKQIEQESYLRSTLAPLSNQGLRVLTNNGYIGGAPTYRKK